MVDSWESLWTSPKRIHEKVLEDYPEGLLNEFSDVHWKEILEEFLEEHLGTFPREFFEKYPVEIRVEVPRRILKK